MWFRVWGPSQNLDPLAAPGTQGDPDGIIIIRARTSVWILQSNFEQLPYC